MRQLLAALLIYLFSGPSFATSDPSMLLQLVDYVGVDYPEAVSDGRVINEFEYAEMQEFAVRVRDGIKALPDTPEKSRLLDQARRLSQSIESMRPAANIAALTRDIRDGIMRAYPVTLTPKQSPNMARAEQLYRQHCASCHGAGGHGDGPAAVGLEPPPTDFHDAERAGQRSLYGLYNTITLGVDGTAMASYAHLSDSERWTLAFYVGAMYADEDRAVVATTWNEGGGLTLREAVTRTPAELAATQPNGGAMAAWARLNPEILFQGRSGPIETAIGKVRESARAYAAGSAQQAETLAVSAYLDGFELAEASLSNVAPGLVREVEDAMIGLRNAIKSGAPTMEIQRRASELVSLLERADTALNEKSLSPGVAFASSLVILLREGLEAILILGAVIAFLIRTERRDALAYVHYGWIGALAAGVATWIAATWFIDISGAAREVTEGATALLAAGVLFYVGFWMHNKLNLQRWNRFLHQKMHSALNSRTLLGVTLIAFIAVYREVFETVLFYQALWAQVEAGAHAAVLGGALTAAVTLIVLTWAIFKFGLRLPLRQFFAVSAAVLIVLSVIFAGKGIVALQEAGKLPISPVTFPRIELLGIYPNAESLGAQALLVVAALVLVWWNRRGQPAAAA